MKKKILARHWEAETCGSLGLGPTGAIWQAPGQQELLERACLEIKDKQK